MSNEEIKRAPKRLICKCGHIAELHLWVDDRPLHLNPLQFDSVYTIGKCHWRFTRCQCAKLDFDDTDDWKTLKERMNKKIEKVNRHKHMVGIKDDKYGV